MTKIEAVAQIIKNNPDLDETLGRCIRLIVLEETGGYKIKSEVRVMLSEKITQRVMALLKADIRKARGV